MNSSATHTKNTRVLSVVGDTNIYHCEVFFILIVRRFLLFFLRCCIRLLVSYICVCEAYISDHFLCVFRVNVAQFPVISECGLEGEYNV